ncbi:MAG: class I SAM-dependent methyltransferase [Gemmobacter sp.]
MWGGLLDRALRRMIRRGTLRVTYPDAQTTTYGDGNGPDVGVRLHSPRILRRLALRPELAVGEAYMDGTLTVDDDDLHGLIELALINLRGERVWWQRWSEAARDLLRHMQQYNPAPRARRNVAHHYDLSGAFYELFLDADRQYSCAYFRDAGDSLERAQAQKKAHVAAKLLLRPGLRVLDIGCGWGGMALTLARDHGVEVLGITLSEEQHRHATERVARAGLSGRVAIRLMDYRAVEGRFDRIVSVGMFEHVGAPHFRTYFRKVHDLLTDDGVALIHTIGRTTPPGSTNPWIAKYIFPGGYVPALSEVAAAIEREDLWPTDVEVWRLHYARTLRHWHDRFMANRDKVVALYDERFARMWRFYLVASEQTFVHDRQCVFQFQLARRQQAVPLTRDYLYPSAPDLRAAAE